MRVDVSEDIPIFDPPTWRAPTILGYDKFDVEGTPYGVEYNAAFLKTEWTIIAPFDEEVILLSQLSNFALTNTIAAYAWDPHRPPQ